MDNDTQFTWEELAARAIGESVMMYMKNTWTVEKLFQEGEHRALKALEDVRRVLDDESLDDQSCFYRIEAIVCALEKNGLFTSRHDF